MEYEDTFRVILEKWEEYYWEVVENEKIVRIGSGQMSHVDFILKANDYIMINVELRGSPKEKIIGSTVLGFVGTSTEFFILKKLITLISKEFYNTMRQENIKNSRLIMTKTNDKVNEYFFSSTIYKKRFS